MVGEGERGSSLYSKLERTVDHWLAGLRRDRPDLAERVEDGGMSAHAAAIEAGWRKRFTRAKYSRRPIARRRAPSRRDRLHRSARSGGHYPDLNEDLKSRSKMGNYARLRLASRIAAVTLPAIFEIGR